jgi:hypothetical protein
LCERRIVPLGKVPRAHPGCQCIGHEHGGIGRHALFVVDNRAGPSSPDLRRKSVMASQKQRRAAKKNIKKAIKDAKRKQTLKHLPKKTRQALGKQAAKVRQSRK